MFIFSDREISEMRGPTGLKFCTMVSTRPNFIMPVQNFEGHIPKKFRGRKTCEIWPDFGRLWSLTANISETDEDFLNRILIPSTAIPPALGETSPSDLGDLDVESYPPKVHFSEDHISAPRGCCAPKFLHALENDQVLLAHPPSGTAAPFTTFFKGESKIALKCSVLDEGSLEPKGVASWDFATWRAARWGW